jgi:hypothetical protein
LTNPRRMLLDFQTALGVAQSTIDEQNAHGCAACSIQDIALPHESLRYSLMSNVQRCSVVLLVMLASACGGKSTTSPSSTQTRIIGVSGNLAFGSVTVGQTASATLTITNSGNSPLAVSGITITSGLDAVFSPNWTSGTISAGASQQVTSRFAPTVAQSYIGTVTINGDQTTGTNSIAISGSGVAATFTLSGVVNDGTTRQSGRIPNALVEVLNGSNTGKSAISDGEGNYEIAGLTAGTLILSASRSSFLSATKTLNLSADTTVDFSLTPSIRTKVGATCNDGTENMVTDGGACAGNGGVACWLYSDNTCSMP